MIRGIGGQGVKLAGTIIGQAAIYDGRHAVQSMKYGSAITGGETRSEIKVSADEIIYPKVTDIDVYVALTQDDLLEYFEARLYVAEEDVSKKIPEEIKEKLLLVPIFKIANDIVGNSKTANVVLLGILTQLFNIATPESMEKAIKELTPPRFHEPNIKAFKEGLSIDLSKTNSKKILKLAELCAINCKIV
jgi:2-oxoglutarate ferredoxin oxidoreductase subunit gamma